MAALDFPDSPSIGDTFSSSERTWEWDGASWQAVGAPGLPAQTGNAGTLLTTDGTDASWSSELRKRLEIITSQDPITLERYIDSGSGAYTFINKSRASVPGGNKMLLDGDNIGGLYFAGSTDIGYSPAVRLDVLVDGTPSSSSMPGQMKFRTTGKGQSNPVTRIQLNSNGSSIFKKEQHIIEEGTVSSTSWSGTVNYSVKDTGSLLRLTSDASGNWTLNIRFSSSETLDSIMFIGDVLTVVAMVSNGATGYYQTGLQIDGTSVLPKWQDGVAPTTGTIEGTDIYTITILKLGSNNFEVFESVTKFA